METENELFSEILKLIGRIREFYPELYENLEEMPVTIPNENKPEMNLKVLKEYRESLQVLLNKYEPKQNKIGDTINEKFVTVAIKDLRLKTFIGFNESEKKEKQDVVINISYKYDASHAIESDDIRNAFNYKTITRQIVAFVEASHFNLLETLASSIYQLVSENNNLLDVVVSVEKPGALRFCDNVIVTVRK